MLAGFQDEIQLLDVDRADVLAGPAGGAGPDHIGGDGGAFPDDGVNGVGLPPDREALAQRSTLKSWITFR
jgi:hypothetical protein